VRADAHQKVNSDHLKRNAYLYVRQSTIRQVFENTESTKRQYALRQNAMALGWQTEQIIVIDSDLGISGASAVDREGFPTGGRSRHGQGRYRIRTVDSQDLAWAIRRTRFRSVPVRGSSTGTPSPCTASTVAAQFESPT